uniref:Protein kinase domain-containing protein n=1 Tax=Rhabditophanes sp. KR3021 TaxID=114890 RepID=A0AC35TIX5_9BILA
MEPLRPNNLVLPVAAVGNASLPILGPETPPSVEPEENYELEIELMAECLSLIAPKFIDLELLGSGSYGLVVSAMDIDSKIQVAIKRISPFANNIDCYETLKEMKILARFDHPNIINLIEIVTAPTMEMMTSIYLVSDVLETDLDKVLCQRDLDNEEIRSIMHQILKGLKYIHSANIIHRDIKPSNILLDNYERDVKICDFGFGTLASAVPLCEFSHYITTRQYIAPEVILNPDNYTKAIDNWSVGCILAEMFNREKLFRETDNFHQIEVIFGFLGKPTAEDLATIIPQTNRNFVSGLKTTCKKELSTIYPNIDPLAVNLLSMLLVFNPNRRISADLALSHLYFHGFIQELDNSTCALPFTTELNVDNFDKTVLKSMIFEEAKIINLVCSSQQMQLNLEVDQVQPLVRQVEVLDVIHKVEAVIDIVHVVMQKVQDLVQEVKDTMDGEPPAKKMKKSP